MFWGLFSARFDFCEIFSTEGGIFGVIEKLIRELKSYSNERMLGGILQAESSASNFTGKAGFSAKMELSGGNLTLRLLYV